MADYAYAGRRQIPVEEVVMNMGRYVYDSETGQWHDKNNNYEIVSITGNKEVLNELKKMHEKENKTKSFDASSFSNWSPPTYALPDVDKEIDGILSPPSSKIASLIDIIEKAKKISRDRAD